MMSSTTIGEGRDSSDGSTGATSSQTLMRGLDILEAVAKGTTPLAELALRIGLAKSTTHRLAGALTERGYLSNTSGQGYRLGAKMLELGFIAQDQTEIVQIARSHIEELSARSEDTVHLGVLDGAEVLYLDKVAGQRRVTISSRIGDRQPLTSTGLGKALMIDHPPTYWSDQFKAEQPELIDQEYSSIWYDRMVGYAATGRAYDLEENEHQIRCIAAPVRDVSGKIVCAISVSSAALYMNDARMKDLAEDVCNTAAAISRDLGWTGRVPAR